MWSGSCWQAFQAWNATDREHRIELASRLGEMGDVAGSFEQGMYAAQFRTAENLLSRRFLTVFESLTPEGAEWLCSRHPRELRDHPYLRVLQALLDTRTGERELVRSIDNLALLAKKRPEAGQRLIASAVRAVVQLRLGRQVAALAQAREVLAALAGIARGEADELQLAEAKLICVLVHFACGTYPPGETVFESATGQRLLDQRGASAQRLLDVLRMDGGDGDDRMFTRERAGYRALVYPDGQLYSEIAAWRAEDGRHLGASPTEGSGARGIGRTRQSTGVVGRLRGSFAPEPVILQAASECVALAVVGNLPDAVALSRGDLVPAPAVDLVRAAIALAMAAPGDALRHLDAVDGGYGHRIEAMVGMMRFAALTRTGHLEAARRVAAPLATFPSAALVMAATMVSEDDLRALAELVPRLGPVADRAREFGFMGSARLIPSDGGVKPLTRREREVLQGLADGLQLKVIAEQHFLSLNTVKTHVRSLSKKLGASGRAETVRRATELGLLD